MKIKSYTEDQFEPNKDLRSFQISITFLTKNKAITNVHILQGQSHNDMYKAKEAKDHSSNQPYVNASSIFLGENKINLKLVKLRFISYIRNRHYQSSIKQ